MATLRQISGDIHKNLKQMSDDADISFAQVVFWVSFFVNKYRYTKAQQVDSGAYLSIFSDVPVTMFAVNSNPNEVATRKYFELPVAIYDWDKDKAIKFITYSPFDGVCFPNFTGVTFIRTTPVASKRLFMSKYEIPTPKNPYWYRVGNLVYLLGVECIDISSVEIGLITPFDPINNCGLDDELADIEMLEYIERSVLDLGRFVMMLPSDQLNDATDTVTNTDSEVTKQKIVSVNQGTPMYDTNATSPPQE